MCNNGPLLSSYYLPFYAFTFLMPLHNVRFQLGWTEHASHSKWVQIQHSVTQMSTALTSCVKGALVVIGFFFPLFSKIEAV